MRTVSVPLLAIGLLALPVATSAETALSPVDAIATGKASLNLRPRYETVDQDGRPDEANAYTVRTLAGWKTGAWNGLSAMIELIDVGRLNDDYNDGQNGKVNYPVVADPDNTDVNQLYLDWAGLPATNIRAGRQSIKLDNVRFVGNVEFRQVMQVFNGVTIENSSLPNTRLYAGYLGRLKTVDTRQHDTDTLLLNARYAFSPSEVLVGYGYFQDQPDAIAAAGFSGPAPADTSNRIVGLRADSAHPFGEKWKLLYTGEYAAERLRRRRCQDRRALSASRVGRPTGRFRPARRSGTSEQQRRPLRLPDASGNEPSVPGLGRSVPDHAKARPSRHLPERQRQDPKGAIARRIPRIQIRFREHRLRQRVRRRHLVSADAEADRQARVRRLPGR